MARRLRHEELPFLTRAPVRQVHRGHVSLRGGIRARERLVAWDENRRFAYRVEEINMPGIRAFMEEWTVAPVAEDRTELQWTLAFDCARPARLGLQLACDWMGHIFSEGAGKMAATF